MSRPLRLDPEDGWHHVMNRGVARQAVFLTAPDGRSFESLLAEGTERFGVEVHAYCLMANHFHLLVHCPDGGLSPFMQRVASRYTQYLNRRLGRDGPIFRGRFRSLLVDSQRYLSCAGRYIHRNPLDIRPPVDLAQYRWPSYRNYCGLVDAPPWLRLSLATTHGGPDGYRDYVEHDADAHPSASLSWATAMAVAERDDESLAGRARVHRTVQLLMLDLADPETVSELDAMLAFPTPDARRSALRRARQRLEEHSVLGDVARRALELAA